MTDSGVPSTEIVAAVSRRVQGRADDFLSLVSELVAIDSGPDAPDGITEVEDLIADRLGRLDGVIVERRREDAVDHVTVTIPGGDARVALLGHADTVFSRGTAAQRPLRIEGNLAYGPGIADMKGGLAMATLTCEALHDLGGHPTIDFVIVGDEETRVVAPPFMDRLRGADACFVLECGRPGGGYIVRRKGGFWARLQARGRSAHAGVQPERGSSAIVQLCRAVVRVAELHRQRDGLTVSVGTIGGGSAPNVVAADAWAELDIRASNAADLDWARRTIDELAESTATTMRERGSWPAMEPADEHLSCRYRNAGPSLALPLIPQSTGGMSDGCWTAAAGVPTIDGIGPEGADDHSPDEYIDLASVPARAGALASAITTTRNRGGTE